MYVNIGTNTKFEASFYLSANYPLSNHSTSKITYLYDDSRKLDSMSIIKFLIWLKRGKNAEWEWIWMANIDKVKREEQNEKDEEFSCSGC